MTETKKFFYKSDVVINERAVILKFPCPDWKVALIQWVVAIDETPTADPSEIASRLSPTLAGEHWLAAAHAMAETEAVADEAIGMIDIF